MFDDLIKEEKKDMFYELCRYINEYDEDNTDLMYSIVDEVYDALDDTEDYDNKKQVLQHLFSEGVKRFREHNII